jgi:hypothetical protein
LFSVVATSAESNWNQVTAAGSRRAVGENLVPPAKARRIDPEDWNPTNDAKKRKGFIVIAFPLALQSLLHTRSTKFLGLVLYQF